MGQDDYNARARLGQIAGHLKKPTYASNSDLKTKRLGRKKDDALPADWSDVLGQVNKLKELARTPPTSNPGYIRQKNAGKLWVRERIDQLLDAGTFTEVGSVSGAVEWTPKGSVQEEILFTADDFSLRAGHADGATASKTIYMEKLALDLRLPILKLVDGSSGGGSVTTIKKEGWSYIPPMPGFAHVVQQLDLGIPNAGAILGPAIGLGAARVTSCHFSVMAADIGSLFNAGPAVVSKATNEEVSASELGGPSVHCANGTIDNIAANEKECFAQIRRFLSYVPDCGLNSLPPILSLDDSVERDVSMLRSLIPRRRERAYAMLRLIETIMDQGSWFHIGASWGRTTLVGLARLGGKPVGIIANNPEVDSGATDALGAQKVVKHLNLCDVFNLPIVQFVDCPGYAVGTTAERQATMKWGVELGKAYFSTTMPIFNVIVRKCYGVAGGIMTDCRDPHNRVAWPSMESGSLPLAGGLEASHSKELREAGDGRGELYTKLLNEYTLLQNPVRTAAAFGVPEVIDPAETRKMLCLWTDHMYEVKLPERLRDRQAGRIHPVFR